MEKKDVRSLASEELKAWLVERNQPAFRQRQIEDWLWTRRVESFEAMSNLSKELRAALTEGFALHPLEVATERVSTDGTRKYAFRLHDGHLIEGVLIPVSDRVTACVSSQAGCSLSCKFCATGYLPLFRNLTHYEIYDQVWYLNQFSLRHYGRPLTNIVYMGMGEPLLNYRNVWHSIERLCGETGMGLSPRRITVSTAGIAKMIRKLGDDGARFEFALSLHAANDEKRGQMMPINDSNSLDALADALRHFHDCTGTRVTYEYALMAGFNDSLSDAAELARFARIVPSKINLIEYNPILEADIRPSDSVSTANFIQHLERKGLIVNLRRSRGKDVDGACGQLALRETRESLSPA